MPKKKRDRLVQCWCFNYCVKHGDRARIVTARTRAKHIADAEARCRPVIEALSLAARRNEEQLDSEDEGGRSSEDMAQGDHDDLESEGDPAFDEPVFGSSPPAFNFGPSGGGDLDDYIFDPPSPPSAATPGKLSRGISPHSEGTGRSRGPRDDETDLFSDGGGQNEGTASHGSDDEEEEPVGLFYYEGNRPGSEDEEDEDDDGDVLAVRFRQVSHPPHSGAEAGRQAQAIDHTSSPLTRAIHNQDTFDKLVGFHSPGPQPNHNGAGVQLTDLTKSEQATLDHFLAWVESDATEKVYDRFAANVKKHNPAIEILSRKGAATLVKAVTGLQEDRHDMCVNSCMAFVGPHADLDHCTYVREGVLCGEPHKGADGRSRRSFVTIPLLARIRAKFRFGKASKYLADRAQQAAQTFDTSEHKFQDWPDGEVHPHLVDSGFFDEPRNGAFMLSTDGAQFLGKAQNEAWIVLLTSLSSSIKTRFKRKDTFVSTIIPGPNPPGDIESFLWPIMAELAQAAVGFWIWDAAREEWFLWRGWLVGACANQPGSTKINKLAGYQAYYGCKTCFIPANYLPNRQIFGYFPLQTVGRHSVTI